MNNFNSVNSTVYTLESIETKIVSVLYAHINTQFTHNTLFDKLTRDKYYDPTISTNTCFKANYLMVLISLDKKFDDIYTKIEYVNDDELNKTFCYLITIVCTDDKPNTQLFIAQNNVSQYTFTHSDFEQFFKLIVETNPTVKFPNGNTVFHELVITKQFELIKEFVSKNIFDMNCTNDNGLTPVQMDTDPIINLYFHDIMTENKIRELNQTLDIFKDILELNRFYFKETKEHLKNLNKTTNILLETTANFKKNTQHLEQSVISNNLYVRSILIVTTLGLFLHFFSQPTLFSPNADLFT